MADFALRAKALLAPVRFRAMRNPIATVSESARGSSIGKCGAFYP